MRVVAGTARGRRLMAPAGVDTRPTSDRVREAVFGALGSLGVVEEATVLDLFAGSGALGIEALSRGAAHATFVERDPRAVDAIRTNLTATGLAGSARVVRGDAVGFVAGAAGAVARHPTPCNLALIDPPYAFSGWPALLADLDAEVVVIESDRAIEPGEKWQVMREKRYGSTVVSIARRLSEKELAP